MKTRTIGEMLPKLGPDAQMRANAFWTVSRNGNGTHAVIVLRVLVVRNNVVIAQANLDDVARTADYPANERWEPGSEATREAEALLNREEAKDYSVLPCHRFWGVNRAMPWEVVPPPRIPWYKRLWRLIAG